MEFYTPKTKKGLDLEEFVVDLSKSKIDMPINDTLLDEHLFIISTNDTWYKDILTYLHIHKLASHLSRYDRMCIQN